MTFRTVDLAMTVYPGFRMCDQSNERVDAPLVWDHTRQPDEPGEGDPDPNETLDATKPTRATCPGKPGCGDGDNDKRMAMAMLRRQLHETLQSASLS